MDQGGGGGGGDGTEGEPELYCTLGAEGEPELKCTLGADGEPAVTGSESDAEGELDPLHVVN